MWKTSTRCCVIAIILTIRYRRMRCRAIRACRLQFQWLLPSPTWILAIQPVLLLNAPCRGFWGDYFMWPTCYVAKDLEIPLLVDIWENRSDQCSQMSYILKNASFKSQLISFFLVSNVTKTELASKRECSSILHQA